MMPNFIIAISGGPDSIYLLHKLLKNRERPILAHLNHKLRGSESDLDEKFIQNLAKKHDLTLEVSSQNVRLHAKLHKIGIETAARNLRYAFLEKIRKKHNATKILTAHTLDDNLETVIMNKLRASKKNDFKTLRAQIGMRDKSGFIERPLLNTQKKTILKYLKKHQIPYRLDTSNNDLRYRRNWVRHVLIPRLVKKNPNLYREFAAQRKNALLEYDKLAKWAKNWLNPRHACVFLKQFTKLSRKRQNFLLQHLYEKTYGSTQDLNHAQLKEVRQLLLTAKTGKQKRFGKNLIIKIEYGKAKIESIHGVSSARGEKQKTIAYKSPILLDPTLIRGGIKNLIHRKWENGDKFRPSGMRGTKKLQDYFIDAKIPRDLRREIPVWVIPENKDNPEQIVAVGNRVDERFLRKSQKKFGNLKITKVQ